MFSYLFCWLPKNSTLIPDLIEAISTRFIALSNLLEQAMNFAIHIGLKSV